MFYKSETRPYCRCCGKPIRKVTDTIYAKELGEEVVIRSWEEAQRTQNQTVVSVKYSGVAKEGEAGDCDYHVRRHLIAGRVEIGERVIYAFNVWDGETYDDEFFCSNTCSIRFARMVVKNHPEIQTTASRVAEHARLVKNFEKSEA